MSDPFRANSNSQLIREAQIAFLVIGALLCVLVYVAVHRISGRQFHYQQISQEAPVAENVADTPYPAQVLIKEEGDAVQKAFDTINALTHPQTDTSSSSTSSTVQSQPSPKVTSFEALPVAEISIAGTTPFVAMPGVAQANFIEPAAEEKKFDNPFEKIKPSKSFTPLPKPNKLVPAKPLPGGQEIKSRDGESLKNSSSTDFKSRFTPPVIESNFGASGSPKSSSSKPVLRQREFSTDDSQLRSSSDSSANAVGAIEAKQSLKADIVKAQPALPKHFAGSPLKKAPQPVSSDEPNGISSEPNGYQVKLNDSLWSIATDKYGDGRFFRALFEHNRERIGSVDQLEPNTIILIPELAELKKRYPSLCPADQMRTEVDQEGSNDLLVAEYEIREQRISDRFYITKAGDTLFDVARQRLGQASRYLEIYELNQFRIPEQINHLTPLKPGLRLLLPE